MTRDRPICDNRYRSFACAVAGCVPVFDSDAGDRGRGRGDNDKRDVDRGAFHHAHAPSGAIASQVAFRRPRDPAHSRTSHLHGHAPGLRVCKRWPLNTVLFVNSNNRTTIEVVNNIMREQ